MKKAFTLAKDTTYVTQNDNNNVTLNFTKRTRGKYNKNVILNFTKRTNELASCVSLYAQVRSSQKIQDLSSYRFRLGGRNDSNRKELINKPSPAFVVFAKAQTQLLPLSKREGVKNHFLTYLPTNLLTFKPAFTLAEVLITLGIIGVVAAMTIPTLMTHFQQEQTVTKLKKALSVINQAYRLSYDDVGEPESAFNLGAEEYFKTYWAPYIKVLSYCETPESCGYKSYFPWKYYNGSSVGTRLIATTARTTFYSMDGILYVIFTAGGTDSGFIVNNNIYVDINGGAGPNQMGRDLFIFTRVQEDGGGVRPSGYEQSDTNINKNCSKTGSGRFCAEKIRRAGWKIEKDYPW